MSLTESNPLKHAVDWDEYASARPQFFPTPSSGINFKRWRRHQLRKRGITMHTPVREVVIPELADELNLVGRMGTTDKHTHKKIGRNSRLDTIQAAMLTVKLPFLAEWTAKRRRVARLYNNEFADVNLKTPKVPNGYKHVFHNYVLQVDKRDELAAYLKENGIGTQIHYPQALSDLELFNGNKSCAVASDLCQKIISLPLYPEMTDPQISMVVEHVKKFTLRNG